MSPPQEQNVDSAFQKPVAPSRPMLTHVAAPVVTEPQDGAWKRLWSELKENRRVAWITCGVGLLLSWIAVWSGVHSTVLFIVGLGAVGFGGFLLKTSQRGKVDLGRAVGICSLIVGITITLWTIPIVQSLNQRNFEQHAMSLEKASSYAEIAAAGRAFEENRSGIGTGLIIGGLVSGFGVVILASRWLRATERQQP